MPPSRAGGAAMGCRAGSVAPAATCGWAGGSVQAALLGSKPAERGVSAAAAGCGATTGRALDSLRKASGRPGAVAAPEATGCSAGTGRARSRRRRGGSASSPAGCAARGIAWTCGAAGGADGCRAGRCAAGGALSIRSSPGRKSVRPPSAIDGASACGAIDAPPDRGSNGAADSGGGARHCGAMSRCSCGFGSAVPAPVLTAAGAAADGWGGVGPCRATSRGAGRGWPAGSAVGSVRDVPETASDAGAARGAGRSAVATPRDGGPMMADADGLSGSAAAAAAPLPALPVRVAAAASPVRMLGAGAASSPVLLA